MAEKIVPQHFGNIGHAHRCAGMSGVGFLDRIHTQRTNGIGKLFTGHRKYSLKSKVLERVLIHTFGEFAGVVSKKHSRQAWYCWLKQVTWLL